MKLLNYECRIKGKALLCWSIGLILYVAGSMEFEGIAGTNGEYSGDIRLLSAHCAVYSGYYETIDFSTIWLYMGSVLLWQ